MTVSAITALSTHASASIIFSQTPASNLNAAGSDRHFDVFTPQLADDFILSSSAIARSVTWRGVFAGNNTPVFPLTFDLFIYGSTGTGTGVPNRSNVLSTTSVSFTLGSNAVTSVGVKAFGVYDVYEFKADLTPVSLTAGTRYWFSVLANTSNDTNDSWYWTTSGSGGNSAFRTNINGNGAFSKRNDGSFYFTLDDSANSVVPEAPTIMIWMGIGLSTALWKSQRKLCCGDSR